MTQLEAGDAASAAAKTRELLVEWPLCQDRLVHTCALYSTHIAREHGEATMHAAHLWISSYAADAIDSIVDPERRGTPDLLQRVLTLLRAHTMEGTLVEDEKHVTIELDCSSGLRMWRRGVDRYGVTADEAPWTVGRRQLPYYCCRCTANLMTYPREQGQSPLRTVVPPASPKDHCTWIVPKS
ncbi:MAG: hypothetical protein GEU93_04630 [Propionibacteriales bacterium]|nr:hypothetical protein [Propionibacteriales bacterium]